MQLTWHRKISNHWHSQGKNLEYWAYPVGSSWDVYATNGNGVEIEIGKGLSDFDTVEKYADKYEAKQ